MFDEAFWHPSGFYIHCSSFYYDATLMDDQLLIRGSAFPLKFDPSALSLRPSPVSISPNVQSTDRATQPSFPCTVVRLLGLTDTLDVGVHRPEQITKNAAAANSASVSTNMHVAAMLM